MEEGRGPLLVRIRDWGRDGPYTVGNEKVSRKGSLNHTCSICTGSIAETKISPSNSATLFLTAQMCVNTCNGVQSVQSRRESPCPYDVVLSAEEIALPYTITLLRPFMYLPLGEFSVSYAPSVPVMRVKFLRSIMRVSPAGAHVLVWS